MPPTILKRPHRTAHLRAPHLTSLVMPNGATFQVMFEPYEFGVVEYGTTVSSRVRWGEMPTPPVVPRAQIRKAFEELGALYCIFWQEEGGRIVAKADFESPLLACNSQLVTLSL